MMRRSHTIMIGLGLVALGLISLGLVSSFNLGTYLYRRLFLEKQPLKILVLEDERRGTPLETLMDRFAWQHPEFPLSLQRIPHGRFLKADDTLVEGLEGFDLVLGSSVQGRNLCDARAIDCDLPVEESQELHPLLLQRVKNGEGFLGIPLHFTSYLLAYSHRQLLPQGITADGALLGRLKTIRRAEDHIFGLGLGDDAFSFLSLLGGTGFFDESRPDARRKHLVEAFTRLESFSFVQRLMPVSCTEDCLVHLFTSRKLPLLIGGEWLRSELEQALGEDLQVNSLTDCTAAGLPLTSSFDGRFLFRVQGRTPEQKEAIAALAHFLTSVESQSLMARHWHKYPARLGVSTEGSALQKSLIDIPSSELEQWLVTLKPVLHRFSQGRLLPEEAVSALSNDPSQL